ncbi:hypothetical protein L598_000900001140 [Mesorhizobium sp. J18]|uniref:hypothetical protein n=1 Tax=Mesorhizobium sp. J18 TaxID=935263 RepID=UPI0011991EB4|nr:hypothetical protein [Mesorhizobium sp. J18]TWG89035.1 hypothetical protein L598_000900001140 [Mesorhizobium sp. J18]
MSELAAPVAIAGADGCKAGWVAVMVRRGCGPQVAVFDNSQNWSNVCLRMPCWP